VLVIAPHPDDETLGCAGAVLLHQAEGAKVAVAIATDGRASRTRPCAPSEMANLRRREAEEAARRLGVELDWIGLPERAWTPRELGPRLAAAFARLDPDLVYAPSRVDLHPEHHQVARTLADVPGLERTRVRVYPIFVPLTPALANVALDVSKVAAQIEQALLAHDTQAHNIRRGLRMKRYTARWHGFATYGEEFLELSGAAYAELHRTAPESWSQRFVGVRLAPFRDPLAYLVAIGERRRLARLAADPACDRSGARP
jgi:LmbE family N-acetylglucosaminyl deacetylase